MTLSLSALPSLNSSLTALPGTEGFCHDFYGYWPDSRDCTRAIDRLAKGSDIISYTVDQGSGLHGLPLHVQSGKCMIQIQMAGPRYPRTIDLVPDEVRTMAERVQGVCVKGTAYYGGFLTSDMSVLKGWVAAEETKLDGSYPTSTAFLTVTISSVVPDWLQPGNFDPHISYLLAAAEYAASSMAFLQSRKTELRRRGKRFLTQYEKMQPRGQRIPWWRNPRVGDANGTSHGTDIGNVTAPIILLGEASAGTDAMSERRRGR